VVNRPSVPEIITVNSEELQTQIRDLLPSQNGFGSELQASNVITPIIDLTRAAEGSTTPEMLQTALAFGSQTTFSASNSTATVANSTGFYRIFGTATILTDASAATQVKFNMSDGISSKTVWSLTARNASGNQPMAVPYDFVVFLAAGHSITADTNTTNSFHDGSVRQIATGDGTLVQPNGFPL
jgi:hypothetical protein